MLSNVRAKFFGDPCALLIHFLSLNEIRSSLQFLQLMMQINPNALKALAFPKKHNLDLLKMEIADMLEDDGTDL